MSRPWPLTSMVLLASSCIPAAPEGFPDGETDPAPCVPDAAEPNNSRAEAHPLLTDETLTANDLDWFELELEPNMLLTLLSTGAGVSFDLELDNQLVPIDGVSVYGTAPPRAGALVLIRVRPDDRDDCADYRFELVERTCIDTDPDEPDNTMATATVLETGVPRTGLLEPGDIDVLGLEPLNQGETMSVRVDVTRNPADTLVDWVSTRLVDADGTILDEAGLRATATLAWTNPDPEAVALFVELSIDSSDRTLVGCQAVYDVEATRQ